MLGARPAAKGMPVTTPLEVAELLALVELLEPVELLRVDELLAARGRAAGARGGADRCRCRSPLALRVGLGLGVGCVLLCLGRRDGEAAALMATPPGAVTRDRAARSAGGHGGRDLRVAVDGEVRRDGR